VAALAKLVPVRPKSPQLQPSALVLDWQANWVSLVALLVEVALVVWYLRAVSRVKRSGRAWPPTRTASFVLGMAVAAYAVEGGIARYQRDNFTAHVVQLLLLVDIVPPLLALGVPLRLALQVLRGRRGAAMTVMYVDFLTPLYAASERGPASLGLVDLLFVAAGCFMWWPLVGRDALARPAGFGLRFLALFASVPFNAFLGVTVAGTGKAFYPAGNTLADTRSGGNVLWGLAEVLVVAAFALLFVEWAREEERKAQRADRQLDAALAAARSAPTEPGAS
jgi:putative membrane protein